VGSFWDLLPAYSILAGVAMVALSLLHGSVYLAMKTVGPVQVRSGRLARRFAVPAAALALAFVIWTHVRAGGGFLLNPLELVAVLAAGATVWLVALGRWGWAFLASASTIAGSVLVIFVDLYPRVMVSSLNPAWDLTVTNTSSGSYALGVMTVVLAVLFPIVLTYQIWAYRVFRRRPATESTVE
jgi:cytochrome d ubiquinol oxidase subunit II